MTTVRSCEACHKDFVPKSHRDQCCDECDKKAVEQYAQGVPVDDILAWYPLTLTGLRERASQARTKRGQHCLVCGKLQTQPGVCPKCRTNVIVYAAQHGIKKAAKKYHLSQHTIQDFGRAFLD